MRRVILGRFWAGARWAGAAILLAAANAQAQDALAPLVGIDALSMGFASTCALEDGGRVLCWGRNQEGQLGVGNEFPHATAAPVLGLPGPATAVASGRLHVCAVVGGNVWCWGRNFYGEIGDGTTVSRVSPVQVLGINGGATALALGDLHSCAIVNGGVRCWGNNAYGQLGNDIPGDSATAVAVDGLTGVTQLVSGSLHSCALAGGAMKCWGSDYSLQIGDGAPGPIATTPQQVQGLQSGVVAMAAGADHTCAIVAAGAVKCWGDNDRSQLGNGTIGGSDVPIDPDGVGIAVLAISAGQTHTCAIGIDHTVRCWGGNDYGQLGSSMGVDSAVALAVPATAGHAASVSIRGFASCAALDDGRALCWGFNGYGQAGDGSETYRTAPVLQAGTGATSLAAGGSHTCGVLGGGVWCWGYNEEGAIGTGAASLYVSTPTAIASLASGATAVAAGYDHSCAVVQGAAWCWGNNEKGQLGDGTNNNAAGPVAVAGFGSGVTAIAAGGRQTCAIRNAQAYCWGYNGNGELGNGTTVDANAPTPVSGLAGVTALSVGPNHTCAIAAGAAKCWGVAYQGQLGDGAMSGLSAVPVQVQGMTAGTTWIAAGYNHSCAVVNGAAKCWGNNGYGQLGIGALSNYELTPTTVTGLGAGVTQIAGGDDVSCAIADGSALCWGGDYEGDVGDGGDAREQRLVPTRVLGLSNIASGGLSINGTHVCALVRGTDIACWGDDFFGSLGIGRAVVVEKPITVVVDDRIFSNGID